MPSELQRVEPLGLQYIRAIFKINQAIYFKLIKNKKNFSSTEAFVFLIYMPNSDIFARVRYVFFSEKNHPRKSKAKTSR